MIISNVFLNSPMKVLLIGLTAVSLTSCSSALDLFPKGQPSPMGDVVKPSPTVSPTPVGATDGIEQPTRCETANYYTEVIWQDGQPRMTLVQRANAANGYQDTKNLNNAPATRTVNSDRSLTYTATIEGGVIHTRVYPNGSCLIQSVASSNGTIVFEEYGRIGGITPQPAINPLSLQPIQPAIVPPGPTQQKPQVLPPGPTQTTPPTKLPASPAPIQPRPAITETRPAPSPR